MHTGIWTHRRKSSAPPGGLYSYQSRPTRRGRAPLEGDYLKPRLSRGFFVIGPNTLSMGHRMITARLPLTTGWPPKGQLEPASARREEDMWLAIAAITLLAAIGFIALAFAVQFRALVGHACRAAAVPSPCHQSRPELA